MAALLRLSDPEFAEVVPAAEARRADMRAEHQACGGVGDAFTAGALTVDALLVHGAMVAGEAYELALTALVALPDSEFDKVINDARERRADLQEGTLDNASHDPPVDASRSRGSASENRGP